MKCIKKLSAILYLVIFAGICSSHATDRDWRLEHRVSKTNPTRWMTRMKINEEKTIEDAKAIVASISGIPVTALDARAHGDILDNETVLKDIPTNIDMLIFRLRKGADVSSSDETEIRFPIKHPTSKAHPTYRRLVIKTINGDKNIADLKAVIAAETDTPATHLVARYQENIYDNETILKNLPKDIALLRFEFRKLELGLIAENIQKALQNQNYTLAHNSCDSVLNDYLASEDDKKKVETWLEIMPKPSPQ